MADTDTTTEAEAEAPVDPKPKRDRSEKPEDLIAKATAGVNDVVITRMGHFHAGGGKQGGCFAAVITSVQDDGSVNIVVWPVSRHSAVARTDGAPGEPQSLVRLPVCQPADAAESTFHLSRDCPWGR